MTRMTPRRLDRFYWVCPAMVVVSMLAGDKAMAVQMPSLGARWSAIDRDADGVIRPAELPREEVFRRLDQDADGVITREEGRRALTMRGAGPARSAVVPDGVVAARDLSYGDGDDDPQRRLDVYRPETAQNAPVLVYVHGGGWRRGDKAAVGQKMPYFTSKGYVFVSVNYRMLPQAVPRVQADDVADAVLWVHQSIRDHGGDPGRIFLMGHSAGAHLVTLVGTDDRRFQAVGEDLSILRGVIELDTAVFDLAKLMRNSSRYYATVFGEDEQVWTEVSPMSFVAAGKKIPPMLLIVAAGNPVKRDQTERFAEALKKTGSSVEVIDASDKTHRSLNQEIGLPGDAITAAIQGFLNCHDEAECTSE